MLLGNAGNRSRTAPSEELDAKTKVRFAPEVDYRYKPVEKKGPKYKRKDGRVSSVEGLCEDSDVGKST